MDIMTGIRKGMHVVDANGKNLGRIDEFQAGDPEAVMADELLESSRHHPGAHPFSESVDVLTDANLETRRRRD